MPIAISVILYDKGANGVPTTTNPQPLRALDSYQHAIIDRFGFESASCSWAASRADILEWARVDHLGRAMEAYSPDGKKIWEGQLSEIAITIGSKKLVFNLKDMANRLKVRYSTNTGSQGATTQYSSAASIASFGTKDRVLNLSTVSATAADNRVQTALNQIAYPTVKQSSEAGTGRGSDQKIELMFTGWYGALDWLATSSASTTVTATNTQVANLLTAYNGTNAFFNTTPDLVATGVSDTEYIDDDSTYREKIETLLAHGNFSKQRLAWGVYEEQRFRCEVWAGATPSTVTYYERGAIVTDTAGNVVAPWDVRPNAMAQVIDVLDSTMDGAIEGPTRKYVARVQCKVDNGGASCTLEPDSVDTLEALLSSPTGAGPAGVSERQAAFERKIAKPARTRFSGTNGKVDAGGGTITNPGGGTVDLTTGTGIGGGGSSGVTTSGGTAGAITKWATATTLGDAVAGTDYSAPGHTHDASAIVSGTMATARLGSGTASSSTYLRGDQTWATISAGVSGSGTTGRVAEWTSSSALQASTLAKSGTGVLTLSASGTATLTVSSSGTLNMGSGTLTLGPDLTTSGAGATITLSAAGAYTLTIPATGTVALLGTAQTFTAAQTINSTLTVGTTGSSSLGSPRLYVRGNSTSSGSYAFVVDNSGSTAVFTVQNNGTIGTSGDYRINGNLIIADQRTGWTIPTGTASRAGYDTSTATLTQVAQTLYALIFDLKNWHGLIA